MYRELAEFTVAPTWAMSRDRAEEAEGKAPVANGTRGDDELAAWTQHAMRANGFGDA